MLNLLMHWYTSYPNWLISDTESIYSHVQTFRGKAPINEIVAQNNVLSSVASFTDMVKF